MLRFACLLVLTAASCATQAIQIQVPERDPEAMARGERSPQLQTIVSEPPWIRKAEHDGVVYFLYAEPALLKRYSLRSRSWLGDIVLHAVPRGLAVSSAGIIVNQDTEVTRFDLSGATSTTIPTAWVDADDIGISGNHLLTSRNKRIQSIRLSDNAEVAIYESPGGYDSPVRFQVAADTGVIFGWQVGLSPLDMLRIPVHADGSFGPVLASPYHGDFPASRVVHPSPDGSIIVDPSGIAYQGDDLHYLSGTDGPFRDIAFHGDLILTLRHLKATVLTRAFAEIGVCPLLLPAHTVAMHDDHAFFFRQDAAAGVVVDEIALSQCRQAPIRAPDNPEVVPYVADSIGLADDGMLYLFNRAQRVIHRFSIPQWRYLESASLPGEPRFASVGASGSLVYVAYAGGRIGVVRRGETREAFLAYGPMSALAIAAADDHVLTVDNTGAWNSHRIYNLNGVETDWVDWNYYSQEIAWNRNTRRMYFFSEFLSPSDLHFEVISHDGEIIQGGDSPYHGEVQTTQPIRANPDGSRVYLGSGQVFDGADLTLAGHLGMQPEDLTWLNGTMYSLHRITQTDRSRVTRWTHGNAIVASAEVLGRPGRLFAYGSDLISVTHVNGRTLIQRWPASLSAANLITTVTTPATAHLPGQSVSFVVEIVNGGMTAVPAAELAVTLSAPLSNLSWFCETPTGFVACGDAEGLTVSAALEPGERMRASASASMHITVTTDVIVTATASGATNEIQPEDNVASGRIRANGLFADGFELE